MKNILFIFWVLSFQLQLQAANKKSDSALCEDLATFTCAPGVYDDGTGTGEVPDDPSAEALKIFLKKKPAVETKIGEALKKSKRFVNTSVAAFGLTAICEDHTSEICQQVLKSGLTKVLQELLIEPSPDEDEDEDGEVNSGKRPPNKIPIIDSVPDLHFVVGSKEFGTLYKDVFELMISDLKTFDRKAMDEFEKNIKSVAVEVLKKNVAPSSFKNLEEKLSNIEYELESCKPTDVGVSLADHLIPDANYSLFSNTLRFCKGFFNQNSSLFSIVTVVGHEMGHGTDPCGIEFAPKAKSFRYSEPHTEASYEKQFPYAEVIQCLRGDSSIQARKKQNRPTGELSGYRGGVNGPVGPGPGAPSGVSLPNAPYYGNPAYPQMGSPVPISSPEETPKSTGMYPIPPNTGMYPLPHEEVRVEQGRFSFCNDDQILESFSDWFGIEVLMAYTQKHLAHLTQDQKVFGIANAFRPICKGFGDPGKKKKFNVHPEQRDRINRLLLVHPKVREILGCSKPHSKYAYCKVGNEASCTNCEQSKNPVALPK